MEFDIAMSAANLGASVVLVVAHTLYGEIIL
jgi:hypothetical protein